LYIQNHPLLIFKNESDGLLREPKYVPGVYNLDRLDPNGIPITLQIPVFSGDWIRPRETMGPQAFIGQPAVTPFVNKGDRLFGFIIITCPECVRVRSYWFYAVHGEGGWYCELPAGQGINLATMNSLALEVRGDTDATLARIAPIQNRKGIAALR
jgi:hypothetical protein